MNTVPYDERYRLLIENMAQLPSLPAIVAHLIKVVSSPETSAEDAAAASPKRVTRRDLLQRLRSASTTSTRRLSSRGSYVNVGAMWLWHDEVVTSTTPSVTALTTLPLRGV